MEDAVERVQKVVVEAAPSDQPRWPEVIGLISDTRKDLGAQIQEVSDKFDRWILPTENRITLIEANQASHARMMGEHNQVIRQNTEAIHELQGQQEKDEAATKAILDAKEKAHEAKTSRWDWRLKTLGAIGGLLVCVPAVEELVKLLQ